MRARKILVIDDIQEVKHFLLEALTPKYDVRSVGGTDEAGDALSKDSFDAVIIDSDVPGANLPVLIENVQRLDPRIPVIAVTGYADGERLAALMETGVHEYVEKPFTVQRIVHTLEKAFAFTDLRRENEGFRADLRRADRATALVGNSPAMRRIHDHVHHLATTKTTVLIRGESGTGKELVAREIHRLSDRRDEPFIKIDCTSMPDTVLETELFGHESAGFTGMPRAVPGKLEMADKGTVLLDEIGELPQSVQARVLRLVQQGEFERVGGTQTLAVDVRVIATTSRSLRKRIDEGAFREDLFYCLNVLPIEVLPLRDRREDIPLLVQHFVEKFSDENEKPPIQLTERALEKLIHAYWRGNVRELENLIERAVILGGGSVLDENYFEFDDARDERLSKVEQTFRFGSVREMEKLMIIHRLTENDQNRTRAARTLDISVRTLRNKLREYRQAESPREQAFPSTFEDHRP